MDSSRLARKRLKPTVSLAAVHRKPKDENQPPKNDGNEEGKASNGSETSARVVELTDVKCPQEDSLPQDGVNTVTTNCLEGSKPGPRAVPFRSRFIRPKPRLDLVQRPASKQQTSEAEEERANNVKAVAPEQCKSVTAQAPNVVQEVAIPDSDDQDSITATSPQKSRPDTSSDAGSSFRGKTDGRDLSPIYETRPPPRKRGRRWRLEQIRKNLQEKLENGKPNRNRLTMFDLIYYNPTSNPMKHPEICGGTQTNPDETVCTSNEERLEEERADEPSAGAELEEEEEVAMPVPQVKVGPDGQIIIDEQSLVIETTGTQKNREDLQNSSVVMDYGTGSTTYNAYSKKTKMKTREWSKEDTLKFYRALQNIGTDFLLMQTFFPKLTRKEIKAKFKKEERVNKELVDKALQNPLKFDISELRREFDKMEEEEKTKKKPIVKPKSPRKSRSDTFFKSLDDTEKKKRGRQPKRPVKQTEKPEKKESGDDGTYQWNYDDLVLDTGPQKDSSPKVKKTKVSEESAGSEVSPKIGQQQQPTRSGRIPQPKVMEDFTSLPDEDDEEEEEEVVETVQPEKLPVLAPVVKVRAPREHVRGGARPVKRPRRTTAAVPITAPTRSGRVPVRKVFEDYVVDEDSQAEGEKEAEKEVVAGGDEDEVILEVDADVMEESVVLSTETSDFTHTLGNLGSLYSNVPPGAVVVLATESPDNPGQQVYKVFMVSGNDRMLPVSLDADDDGGGGDGELLLADTQLQQ